MGQIQKIAEGTLVRIGRLRRVDGWNRIQLSAVVGVLLVPAMLLRGVVSRTAYGAIGLSILGVSLWLSLSGVWWVISSTRVQVAERREAARRRGLRGVDGPVEGSEDRLRGSARDEVLAPAKIGRAHV